MDSQPFTRRSLVAYASANAFAAGTLSMLSRLGYNIVSPEKFEKLVQAGDVDRQPDLHLVEEARLGELPSTAAEGAKILVLARHDTAHIGDPRIVAAMKPPVGMHDLFRLLQQLLEDRPRAMMRVRTRIDALCRRSGHEWRATIVSLSENGCLLESPEPVPLATALQLGFELPGSGTVHVRAETAYQLLPQLGLVFSSTSPRIRTAIAAYVEALVMAGNPAE